MPRTAKPMTARDHFVRLLWMQFLFAIPFGLFFSILFNRFPQGFPHAFGIALVFAYTIGIAMWAIRWATARFFPDHARVGDRMAIVREIALYIVVCTGAALLAAWIVHLTLLPGMLSGARQVVIVVMFNLVFAGLFTGVAYAFVFYREAVEKAKSEQELHLARRIQRGFLLSRFPERPRVEVHAVNVSSKQVSGDFYDVVAAGDDGFLLAIADVSGKGVPAALLSSMLQASLRTQAPSVSSVGEILRNVNALVCGAASNGQFATFFLARVTESSLTLEYSNAGHNFPVVFRADGNRVELDRGGTVVGILEGLEFEEARVPLAPGDRVVFYTDGITEAANAGQELYGEERLYRLVESLPRDLSARELTEAVLEGVRGWLDGIEPGDDMTVMALRVLADGAPAPARSAATAG